MRCSGRAVAPAHRPSATPAIVALPRVASHGGSDAETPRGLSDADPPTCRKPRPRTATGSTSLTFDRYMKAQPRLAGGRRKLGRNGFSSDIPRECVAPPRISARPARPCPGPGLGNSFHAAGGPVRLAEQQATLAQQGRAPLCTPGSSQVVVAIKWPTGGS